jgi:Myc proto-oncogene protein
LFLLSLSDSIFTEEEIDVDTIMEKNLPTNPSARDRRALQTTVAHKFARSKHTNQRRRVSDDDSISSSTSTLSSKGSTPIKYGSQTPARYISSNSTTSGHSISRKRSAPGHSKDTGSDNHHKRYRTGHNKKQKMSSRHQKPAIDQEELDTIEKRNLHNNMERQRRIGLKNLFEELKCHVPILKDKERAPKVNILREAALHCIKLRREDEQYNELVKKHNRLMTRLRNLKASIAAQQRRNY